jgi:hypothetical protein
MGLRDVQLSLGSKLREGDAVETGGRIEHIATAEKKGAETLVTYESGRQETFGEEEHAIVHHHG